MKPLILIGCLVCLCALADTNFPIITYSNGVAHTNEYLVFKGTNSYFTEHLPETTNSIIKGDYPLTTRKKI